MSRSDFLREDSKETLVSLAEFKGEALLWRRSGERQSRTAFRPFAAGKNPKKPAVSLAGIAKGRCPFGQQSCERGRLRSQFCCGEEFKETGRFRGGGIQRGRRPIGTRPCLQGLVCYTFCGRGRGKGAAAMGSPQNEVLWGEEEQRSE